MRYLVMECGFSYAVVLDQQGRFLKVANLGYAVGQTVDSVIPFQEEQKKSRTSRRVIPVLAAAACLCLVFLGGLQYILSPYGTVRIQINPDVMISVNRWDYAVDVEGMNDDGEELVEDYHYIGKKVDQVSDELADLAVDQGFLKEGDQITLTVESEHEDWKTATEDLLITELTIHLDSSVEIRTAGEAEEEMEREDPVLPQENDSDPGSGRSGGNSGNVVSDDDDDDDGDDDNDDDDDGGDDDDDDDDDDGDDDDDDDDD
nr:hypothetical protein [Massilistercora timonensis]